MIYISDSCVAQTQIMNSLGIHTCIITRNMHQITRNSAKTLNNQFTQYILSRSLYVKQR